MYRDIFLVFFQWRTIKDNMPSGPLQVMGAYYSIDKAKNERKKIGSPTMYNTIRGETWIERTKITR